MLCLADTRLGPKQEHECHCVCDGECQECAAELPEVGNGRPSGLDVKIGRNQGKSNGQECRDDDRTSTSAGSATDQAACEHPKCARYQHENGQTDSQAVPDKQEDHECEHGKRSQQV